MDKRTLREQQVPTRERTLVNDWTQSNPIEAVVEQWCKELNRRSFARQRQIAALLCVFPLFWAPHPWAVASGALLALLGLSLLIIPAMHLGNLVRKCGDPYAFVDDRLLMLLAESPTLDRATKQEFAHAAALYGGLTYDELFSRARCLRRSQGPGCRALAAFANETWCEDESDERRNAGAPGATLLAEGH